jgi:hypothetical protein
LTVALVVSCTIQYQVEVLILRHRLSRISNALTISNTIRTMAAISGTREQERERERARERESLQRIDDALRHQRRWLIDWCGG